MIKKIILGILSFLLPSFILTFILRILGYKIGKNVKIGFSFLMCSEVSLEENVRIGHFNLLLNESLFMKQDSKIGYLNITKGPFEIILKNRAAIGNKNYFTRGGKGVTYGKSSLILGELTKITVGHHIDLTRSIHFGDFSILAGIRSQIWTHGYVHEKNGAGRIRVDGEIHVGDNVYIGSGCIFNPGVKVNHKVTVGSGTVISKSLIEEGMYINQRLRFLPFDIEDVKERLLKVDEDLIEMVYKKN